MEQDLLMWVSMVVEVVELHMVDQVDLAIHPQQVLHKELMEQILHQVQDQHQVMLEQVEVEQRRRDKQRLQDMQVEQEQQQQLAPHL